MHQRHAEHHTGNKADGDLHPAVGEAHQQGDPAADERHDRDRHAIEDEPEPGGHGELSDVRWRMYDA